MCRTFFCFSLPGQGQLHLTEVSFALPPSLSRSLFLFPFVLSFITYFKIEDTFSLPKPPLPAARGNFLG